MEHRPQIMFSGLLKKEPHLAAAKPTKSLGNKEVRGQEKQRISENLRLCRNLRKSLGKQIFQLYEQLGYLVARKKEPLQATVTSGYDTWEVPRKYSVYPNDIISHLDLKKPKYEKTAEWGHMGIGEQWG